MDDQSSLFGGQLRHTIDRIDAKLDRIELNQKHIQAMMEHRLAFLEKQAEDHEARIRAATEGVTQFKVWSGLTSAGSSLLSITAMIKALFGG